MNIKCVIFDCDGLMFDTERIAKISWAKVLDKYGVSIPNDLFDRITGSGSKEIMAVLDEYPEVKTHILEIYDQRKSDIYNIALKENIKKHGLLELLEYLKLKDLKVCVASSSDLNYINHLLDSQKIDFKFDFIIGGDKVKKSKPDPEIFTKVSETLSINPDHCLVIEDSKNGHLAAKAANMHRVFIQDLVKPDKQMQEELIEYSFNTLDEIKKIL